MSVFVEVSQYLSKLRGDHLDADGKSQVLISLFNKFISEPSLKKVLLANKGKDVIINVMNKHSNHKLIQFYGAQLLNNIVTMKRKPVQKEQRISEEIPEITDYDIELVSKIKKTTDCVVDYDEYDRAISLKTTNYSEYSELIFKLKHLKVLHINFPCTKVHPLSHEVGNLQHLEELKVGGFIDHIPNTIGNCFKLKRLVICSPVLHNLPFTINKLFNLEELTISCKENDISFIGRLKHLRYLELCMCPEILELPENIIHCSQLYEVRIAGCHNLKRVNMPFNYSYNGRGSHIERMLNESTKDKYDFKRMCSNIFNYVGEIDFMFKILLGDLLFDKCWDLYKLVYRGEINTLRWLLCSGANLNKVYSDGKTLIGIAMNRGHHEIVRMLQEAGARR